MKFLLAFLIATLAIPAVAGNVKGYTRKDGTYVAPHHRTNPDGNPHNNYSTQGNYNPYTGKQGTVDPYATPQYDSNPYNNQRRR